MKKITLNVGTALRMKNGAYDFSGLEQVELVEVELLGEFRLYRRQDGQLLMHVAEPVGSDGKITFFLLEISIGEAEQKITWLDTARFSRN